MDAFAIHKVAVHFLSKQPEQAASMVILADQLTLLTDDVLNLILKLDSNFEKKTDVLLARLKPEGPAFSEGYQEYKFGGADFLDITHRMAYDLSERLSGIIGARGGHLVFCDYTIENSRMFGVFLLRNKQMYDIESEFPDLSAELPTSFVVELDEYLDVDHPAFSLRILQGVERPLQIVRSKQDKMIFKFMLEWVSIDDGSEATTAELTNQFMGIVDQLPIPPDPESGFAMEKSDFDKALIKYAAKQPQQIIRAKSFDDHFYGGEPTLQSFLALPVDSSLFESDFRVDKKLLRKKFHLSAGVTNLRITCTSEHIRDGLVVVDEEKGTVTINSRDIAIELAEQNEE